MLDDVPEIRTAAKSLDEAAPTAQPAVMLITARQDLQKPVDKAWDLIALTSGKALQIEFHHQNRLVTVYIRTWNCTNIQNLHSDLYSKLGVDVGFRGVEFVLLNGGLTMDDERFRRNSRTRLRWCRTWRPPGPRPANPFLLPTSSVPVSTRDPSARAESRAAWPCADAGNRIDGPENIRDVRDRDQFGPLRKQFLQAIKVQL